MGVEIVADLARIGTDIDCRGEMTAEMEGEDAQRAAGPSPTLELATASTTTLADDEGDPYNDIDAPDDGARSIE